jgi:hypothetical protein
MFARFHYSIRPKTIVQTLLVDFGCDAVVFSAKLKDLVLKPTNASEINK